MTKSLQKIKKSELVGFEHRLSLSSNLINRIEFDDEKVYFQFMCGKQAVSDGRLIDALEYFNNVIRIFSELPLEKRYFYKLGRKIPFDEYVNSFLLRGNSYYSLALNDKAISDYSSCIEIDYTIDAAYRNRAVLYINLQLHNEAINDLMVIANRKEFCPEIHRFLGIAYSKLGDYNSAKKHFKISSSQGDVESQNHINNV